MLKRILIATDFSNHSNNAIHFGLSLFRDEPCRFILLNVLETTKTGKSERESSPENLAGNTANSFKKLIKELKVRYPDNQYSFETVVEKGILDTVINRSIEQGEINMLIIGTKESGGIANNLIKRKTAALVRNSSCPVMIVPENSQFRNLDKIIFALDFKNYIPESTFQPLLHLARKFRSEIFLFGIMEKEEDLIAAVAGLRVNRYLEGIPHTFHTPHPENASLEINKFLQNNKPFLMVLNITRITPFDRIINNYLTKKLLSCTDIPVLVMHDSDAHIN